MTDLTFSKFQELNKNRCNTVFHKENEWWAPELWGLAICGEAGELANLLKKVVRGDFTLEERREEIEDEIADVLTYCDLLTTRIGSSTETILMRKFNKVSARAGYQQ